MASNPLTFFRIKVWKSQKRCSKLQTIFEHLLWFLHNNKEGITQTFFATTFVALLSCLHIAIHQKGTLSSEQKKSLQKILWNLMQYQKAQVFGDIWMHSELKLIKVLCPLGALLQNHSIFLYFRAKDKVIFQFLKQIG